MILLRYWRFLLPAALILIIAGQWLFNDWRINRIQESHRKELAEQAETLQAECTQKQQKTQEISHGYQAQLATIRRSLTAYSVGLRETCLPIDYAASGHDGGPSGAKPARSHGVSARALLEYGAEAEQYRQQLIACQSFIRKERD